MIDRKEHLSMLIENKDRDIIKVVTGVRRCGKSTLFALYITWLKENGVSPNQIISVNLEELEYEALRLYQGAPVPRPAELRVHRRGAELQRL